MSPPGSLLLIDLITHPTSFHMAAPKLHTTVPVTARAKGKRPRPSDSSLVGAESEPATAVRRKDGMTSTAGPLTPGLGDSAHYRKGMYLAFIDDAFASRDKVSPLCPSRKKKRCRSSGEAVGIDDPGDVGGHAEDYKG